MRAPGQPYTLTRRGKVYYVRFKLPKGRWSTAKSTGARQKPMAIRWAIDYLKAGKVKIAIRESTTFAELSHDFFIWDGPYALDRRAEYLKDSVPKRLSYRKLFVYCRGRYFSNFVCALILMHCMSCVILLPFIFQLTIP